MDKPVRSNYQIKYQANCPYCDTVCDCDLCDVGVGMIQSGPYHCDACGATEIGPNDKLDRELTENEERTGWYSAEVQPADLPETVNVVANRIVGIEEATAVYRAFYPSSATPEGRRNIRLHGTPFRNQEV